MERVLIIGGGGTGAALAHDLSLRGFPVTVFDRGSLVCGASGRHHGLLHSGARYAVHDPEAARECAEENAVLRRIAPRALEANDGLFVALDAEDLAYGERLLEGCRDCGIPALHLDGAAARRLEPGLNPAVRAALRVPDAGMDPYRLVMSFFATARANGAVVREFCEVREICHHGGRVTGVVVRDRVARRERRVTGDTVVIAAGAWAGRVASRAGIPLPVQPGPGVMVSLPVRVCERVVNRMRPAGEGDIVVPQRRGSVLGTSLWLAEDPDDPGVPPEHVDRMVALCARMVPAAGHHPTAAAWSACRPLIAGGSGGNDPQAISRTFSCLNHGPRDGLEGLFSLIGGKATTLRAMAQAAADRICERHGLRIACRTRDLPLHPYRTFFR